MKRLAFYALLLCLALSACNKKTKEAEARLEAARAYYEQNEFAAAKIEIDSLRALYPKELKVQREGLTLMRLVEIKEAERNIAFCDSVLPLRRELLAELQKDFVFEKDSAYDEVGNFIYRQQTVERNLERSYIRSGVNEKGDIYIASVYYGAKPINHTGLTLSLNDGTFVKTASIAYDGGVNYRFENLGFTTEVVTYTNELGLDALQFIAEHEKERIRAEYTGGSPYVMYLLDNDKKAIAAAYRFGLVLKDIIRMTDECEKSAKRIEYLQSRLQATSTPAEPIDKTE
ncbi:hypothetical protein M2480_000310 [Parabacteroides sp. PFB2-12]|uniref:hypothetical protein n=1 Tax=unclassified Parabacteroides TaxID=2649774 RepID=UPI002476A383|nr:MULTISPECIES: hypothetical protein [unclassified Parabacteroides]MDH6341160.1 hypothetical protein [Parabacteroides sp. PM6-13]MDH6389350.1 hypothetical protein [Parabacteroides sp. PFB2-12]